jgi:cytochrome c-type biogenesis protein CcmH
MSSLAIACIVFAAGCFAALALRQFEAVRRDSLASVLLPLLAASFAGGVYAWYATPRAAGEAHLAQAGVPAHEGSEMQDLASRLRSKLGEESSPGTAPARRAAGDLNALALQLAEKLKNDPANGQGWALLARTYANTQQYGEAEKTFEKAAKLLPRDAQLLADWADARVMTQGGQWDKRARELVQQALSADPKNLKALSLAGSEALERNDFRNSATYWSRMKAAAPANSAEAREAEAHLADSQARLAGKPTAPKPKQ